METMHTGEQSLSGVRQAVQEAPDRIVIEPEEAARLMQIEAALRRNQVVREVATVWQNAPRFYDLMTGTNGHG